VRNRTSDVTEIHAIAHAFVNAGNEGKRRRCDVKKRHCRGNARMYATVIPDKVDRRSRGGYLLVSLIAGGPTSHLGVMRPDKTAINAARDKSVHSRLRPVTIT